MKPKLLVTFLLLSLVGFTFAAMVFKETRKHEAIQTAATARETTTPSPEVPATADPVVVAYYFHGNARCPTCKTIEAQSHEAITKAFDNLIASGDMQWRMVNYDEPGNAHYRTDFQLAFQSLVLVEERGGKMTRWKNLADVWTKIADTPQEFEQYVVDSTAGFLAGDGS